MEAFSRPSIIGAKIGEVEVTGEACECALGVPYSADNAFSLVQFADCLAQHFKHFFTLHHIRAHGGKAVFLACLRVQDFKLAAHVAQIFLLAGRAFPPPPLARPIAPFFATHI